MMPSRLLDTRACLVALAALAGGCVPDAGRPDFEALAYLEIVRAEDARPAGGGQLETLVSATRSSSAAVRAAAVRALGRLERPDVVEHVLPLLSDTDVQVRGEAANALAQSVHGGGGDRVLAPLLGHLATEADPAVRGIVARSLGRLSLDAADRPRISRVLLELTRDAGGSDAPAEQLLGATLGLESLLRRDRGVTADPAIPVRLRRLLRYGRVGESPSPVPTRVRTLAVLTLGHAGALQAPDVEVGLRDPAPAVRRAAAVHLGTLPPSVRPELIRRALGDDAPQVRVEAVRALARTDRDALTCRWLLAAARSPTDSHDLLEALDALARPCPDPAPQAGLLEDVASSLPNRAPTDWHAPAHALVALAALSPERAEALLPRFATHDNPFVRGYAVRAAGRTERTDAVRAFLDDGDANVRTAAAQEIFRLEGRGADGDLLRLLGGATDPQLVLTVAGLLQETPRTGEAAATALEALERLSETRQQSLRDPRLALLDLVAALGEPSLATEVEPYLRDYDARVARRAADLLLEWTGKRYLAAPRSTPRLPYPSPRDLDEMRAVRIRLHMERGGAIEIALLPDLAPTNAFRFLTMARSGVLDGLTFHRVVPNFVIQGGSPGANEYAGHGAYTRDEVGLTVQWEGTVGLSTRGRDTGDGQVYVNLVDNVRLDHDYTVFGYVAAGMDVAHRVMEGDVIRATEIVRAPSEPGGRPLLASGDGA